MGNATKQLNNWQCNKNKVEQWAMQQNKTIEQWAMQHNKTIEQWAMQKES